MRLLNGDFVSIDTTSSSCPTFATILIYLSGVRRRGAYIISAKSRVMGVYHLGGGLMSECQWKKAGTRMQLKNTIQKPDGPLSSGGGKQSTGQAVQRRMSQSTGRLCQRRDWHFSRVPRAALSAPEPTASNQSQRQAETHTLGSGFCLRTCGGFTD